MRRIDRDSFWPEAAPEHTPVIQRWEALLARTPRLRPVLHQIVGRHRLRLLESGTPQADVERTIWNELSRWVRDFEGLPDFAVSAIAVTMEHETVHEFAAADEAPTMVAAEPSPEHALLHLETLLADPAFALALHCIDVAVRPALAECASGSLAGIPEEDWFALLHASARPQATLTAQSAVALVLHVLGERWSLTLASSRQAALRLFTTNPPDVRGDLDRVAAALPSRWGLDADDLHAFAASAARLRAAFAEASRLCGRFVAALRARPGGLSLLTAGGGDCASAAEISALFRNTRKYGHIGGFRKLLALL